MTILLILYAIALPFLVGWLIALKQEWYITNPTYAELIAEYEKACREMEYTQFAQ